MNSSDNAVMNMLIRSASWTVPRRIESMLTVIATARPLSAAAEGTATDTCGGRVQGVVRHHFDFHRPTILPCILRLDCVCRKERFSRRARQESDECLG